MMNEDMQLTEFEKKALALFYEIDENLTHCLQQQISASKLEREVYPTNYFLIFHPVKEAERLPFDLVAPFEIFVDPKFPPEHIFRFVTGSSWSAECSALATGFILHFRAGRVTELEAYSVACDPLDLETACEGRRTYLIEEEVRLRSGM